MKSKSLAILATLLGISGSAAACSYVVQTKVSFSPGSAALDRTQVIKLSEWLGRSYENFSLYTGAAIEAGASGERASKARALADQRAANTLRALRILMPVEVQTTATAYAYRSSKDRFGESNDFASIQLYPDVKGLNLPDCNPVPIPGFKR
jgi:hypothetical protein